MPPAIGPAIHQGSRRPPPRMIDGGQPQVIGSAIAIASSSDSEKPGTTAPTIAYGVFS